MAENSREAELKITADASGVRAGVEQAKTALGDLSKAAEREGSKASAAIKGFGENFEEFVGPPTREAAKQVEQATKSIVGSIERATAALKAGERGSSGYFEALAKQRGVSVEALAPYIEQLRQAEAAQKSATGSLGAMGVSAAQTAAALRQVPAQFTDIATSLAAGQAPLTVFLQQGGQLKDMFGGAGAAAKALGGYVVGLINPLTLAAAAVAAVALAYKQGSDELSALNRALILSGNQIGLSAMSLQDMARAQAAVVGTQAQAEEAFSKLAATGRVSAASINQASEAVVRFSRVGGSVDDTVKKFERLGKEPLKAVVELNEAENFLTVSVYKQIKALEDQGRVTEAANVAQQAYAAALNGRAKQIELNLGSIERGWMTIKDAAKLAWDAMLNVGRQQTVAALDQQIASMERRVQVLAQGNAAQKTEALLIGEQVSVLKEQRAALADVEREQKKAAAASQTRSAETKAAIAADKEAEKAAKGVASELRQQQKLVAELAGLSGDFADDWAALTKLFKSGQLSLEQLTDAQAKLLAKQPLMREQAQAQAQAHKEAAKALDDLLKAEQRRIDTQYKVAEQVREHVQKLQDEEVALGVAAAQNISLAAAIEKVRVARLEEAAAKATAAQDYAGAAALRAEIEAREQLATLLNSKDGREAAKKGAEEAAREWKRTADEIERTITDSLMRGFESGKGFVVGLRDTLVNTFKALVLRPTIQAVVQPLSMALLGQPTLAAAHGGAVPGVAGGPLGSISSLSSLASFFGAGGLSGALQAGAGWVTGSTTLGGSLSAAGSLIGTGTTAGIGSGLAMGAGSLGPLAALLAASYYGGKAISGGYSIGGLAGGGNTSAALALGGGAFLGPLGALVGGLGGGLINRAFGMGSKEARDAGISGTIGGGDVSGQMFQDWFQKGGWFRSNKSGTNYASIDATMEQSLDAGAKGILEGTKAWAAALALPADQLASITTTFRTKLTGNAEEDQKAIAGILQGYSNALTAGFAEQIAPFAANGETAGQTLERLATSLTGVNGVLGLLGQSLLTVGAASGDAASKLLAQFGGLQNYQTIGAQYLQDYYSEAERTAMATKLLTEQFKGIGLAMPASREALRALIDDASTKLDTEAGRNTYAALLQLSGAFAQVVPAVEAVADASAAAAAKMAEAGAKVLADLAAQQGDLQVELLRAQGQAAAAAEIERSRAIAKLTEGLSATDAAAAVAAYDLNAALRAQIDATNAAKAAADQAAQAEEQRLAAVAQQRGSIQAQIDQFLGDTAAIRARELAALDPSNRALQERLYALQDEATAAQAAAAAAQELAAKQASVAQQRDGIQAQIDQLVGDTAAIRARELAGLDESNRALMLRVYALQDEAAAAQALAAKQAAISQQRDGIQSQIDQLLGNTAALRARELAGLDETNRALMQRLYALQDEAAASQAAAQAAQELAAKQSAIAQQRDGIQAQIDQLLGDTAAMRARELAGLDESNRALKQRYYDLLDEQAAKQALAQAQEQANQAAAAAAAEAARQAEQLRQAWQGVSDGIFNEVERIRGLMGGDSPQSLAAAQRDFAIKTAQARAGDQDAAKLLPSLSQSLLQLVEASATSMLDVQRMRAQVAASLEQTGTTLAGRFGLSLPKFDVGTNYVPRDMAAIVHEGEAIVPRAFNPAANGGQAQGNDELVQAVRELLDAVRAGDLSAVKLQTEMTRLFKKWDGEGLPETRATV